MPSVPWTCRGRVSLHHEHNKNLFIFIVAHQIMLRIFFLLSSRPLFKPCKCSGSIGLTHQDCLTSWLDVTRGDGKCELCSTRFRFAPQYADGAPDRLSAREVCFRIFRRLGAKWLPRGMRAMFAAGLWLLVLPLLTAHIYHGWMRKISAIPNR